MALGRGALNVVYRAMGKMKYVGEKLRGTKRRYNELYEAGQDKPHIKEVKRLMRHGYNP